MNLLRKIEFEVIDKDIDDTYTLDWSYEAVF